MQNLKTVSHSSVHPEVRLSVEEDYASKRYIASMFVHNAEGEQIGVAILGPYPVDGLGNGAMAYVAFKETPTGCSTLPLSGGSLPALQNAVEIAIRLFQLMLKKHPGPWYDAGGYEVNSFWPERFDPESVAKG